MTPFLEIVVALEKNRLTETIATLSSDKSCAEGASNVGLPPSAPKREANSVATSNAMLPV